LIATLSLLAVGFFLGMRHATDADHVIAVSTIVSRQRSLRGAAWIGLLWGVGHTLTVSVVGGVVLFFTIAIPERLGLAMEFAVGIMLVALGLFNLAGFRRWIGDQIAANGAPLHAHTHAHGDYAHHHSHGHGSGRHGHREDQTPQAWLDRSLGNLGVYHAVRPVIVGCVHGLAGSAALALILLTAVSDPFWGMAYLLLFGLGTIAGMMMVTLAIAVPFVASAGRFPGFNAYLRFGTGLLSLLLGVFLMYHIGFVEGLFVVPPVVSPG
jgi:hypothetical protein